MQEQPLTAILRAREGALHMAEKLAFHHVGGHGRAVDRHEGFGRPVGQLMDHARRHFLARAGLAGQQHGGGERGNAGDGGADVLDGGRFADQLVAQENEVGAGLQLMAQHRVFPLQLHPVEAAGHRIEDLVGAEGLQHEIRRARLQRLNGRLEVGIGGDQDGGGQKAGVALLGQPVHAALATHDIVEDDDIEMRCIQQACGLFDAGGQIQMAAARAQGPVKEVAHARLVIDDEDRGFPQRLIKARLRRSAGQCRAGVHSPLPCCLLAASCSHPMKQQCPTLAKLAGKGKGGEP